MKKFKQSYPRRRSMLATPFVPLSDDQFRELVTLGSAIPGHQGSTLFVPVEGRHGMETEAFLTASGRRGPVGGADEQEDVTSA